LVAVATQTVVDEGKTVVLPARYLPRQVYDQYVAMMEAMEQDIGQRAYIESGYRSPAYQLYLLLSFLKKYNYSLKTAARRAALPGYSEHGAPHRQAIDFAVETSSADAAAGLRFHDFPPYRWMADHAADHGFYLSYPDKPGPGVGFESWHWHFEDPVTAQISPDTATAKQ
jgi:D-alanyl-D-alanine carboxypeptidase